MSALASAKTPEPNDDFLTVGKPDPDESKLSLRGRLRIWRQVLIGELLNLLEKRRYDACK